jgi:hypothetical protein
MYLYIFLMQATFYKGKNKQVKLILLCFIYLT